MCQVTQSNGLKTNDLAKKTLQGLNWFSLEETILDNSLQWRLKIEVMAIFCPLCPQNILFTIGGRIARFMGCAAYLSTLNSDHQLEFDQWSLIKSGMITAQCWGRLNWRVGRCLSDLRNGSLAVGSTRIINGEITKLLNSEFFWFFSSLGHSNILIESYSGWIWNIAGIAWRLLIERLTLNLIDQLFLLLLYWYLNIRTVLYFQSILVKH